MFIMFCVCENALAVIRVKGPMGVLFVMWLSSTLTFVSASFLMVFFKKYVFFLFDSASVTSAPGFAIAISRPGNPAPVPISSTFSFLFMCSKTGQQSLMSLLYIASTESLTKRLCVLL